MFDTPQITQSQYLDAVYKTDSLIIDYAFRDWIDKMPYLRFSNKWEVQIIPPFAGALVRFCVKYKERSLSIYFDGYQALGYMEQPYWDVYPDTDGDPVRFLFGQEKKMMAKIKKLLES